MQNSIVISTNEHEGLYDITDKVEQFVHSSDVKTGLLNIYVRGATAAIMIQENWDESVQQDVLTFLRKQIPKGVWEHDKQDNNGDAHLKEGLIGPSETIPIIFGKLGLSHW
jgi:secondary thiamine-phosphate synthase enzyme